MTTVETVVARFADFISESKNNVAIDAEVMFTMLLPTSTVDKSLSKFSVALSTAPARLLPFASMFISRILLTDVKAISEAEK